MVAINQIDIDRAMRVKLSSSRECGTNTSGLLFKMWVFDTTLLYGDFHEVRLPACFDEMTARYVLAQYLAEHK